MTRRLPALEGPNVLYDLFAAAANSILAVNAHGRIGYLNQLAAETFGYSEDELVGASIERLLPWSELLAGAAARAQGPTGALDRHPSTARRRDGTSFPVEASLVPVDTAEGKWWVTAVTDVSALREAEERLRSVDEAYRVLVKMNDAVVRATDPEELFRETCRVAVSEVGYLGTWVGRPRGDRGFETVTSSGVLDGYISRSGIDRGTGPLPPTSPSLRVVREGRPVYTLDFLNDPATAPWHELAIVHGIRASAALPLRCRGEIVAVFGLWSAQPAVFDAEVRLRLEGMAENISHALGSFETSAQLTRVAAERSQLLDRLVAAQERERARIAADVHDDSVQGLAAVDLRLGLLQRRVGEAAPELVPMVSELQRTLEGVTAGLRDLLFELEPAHAGTPLVEILQTTAEHTFHDTDVAWTVDVLPGSDEGDPVAPTDEALSLPATVGAQAARVAKEAMINVRKHARASQVRVRVRPTGDGVEIAVTDDGVGLDPENLATAPGHRGLAAMRDRTQVAGGWCRLEREDRGTTLRFWMPRTREVDEG